MATYEKIKFSGLTGTENVKILEDNDFATIESIIHSTSTSATVLHEVWLWAYAEVALTVNTFYVGTATQGPCYYKEKLPQGTTLICPGLIISGNGTTAASLYAGFYDIGSSSFEKVSVFGYVNRITP